MCLEMISESITSLGNKTDANFLPILKIVQKLTLGERAHALATSNINIIIT